MSEICQLLLLLRAFHDTHFRLSHMGSPGQLKKITAMIRIQTHDHWENTKHASHWATSASMKVRTFWEAELTTDKLILPVSEIDPTTTLVSMNTERYISKVLQVEGELITNFSQSPKREIESGLLQPSFVVEMVFDLLKMTEVN